MAKHQFYKDQKRKDWVKQQADRLLQNELEVVIKEVQKLKPRCVEAKEAKIKLLRYYKENDDRMQYKTYRDKGLMIGSGPIEAAHRSVIQQRMKTLWAKVDHQRSQRHGQSQMLPAKRRVGVCQESHSRGGIKVQYVIHTT